MKLLEDGWQQFKSKCIPADASQIQVDEMHKAFFIGADFLFYTLMDLLEKDTMDCTDKDLNNVEAIHQELQDFRETVTK